MHDARDKKEETDESKREEFEAIIAGMFGILNIQLFSFFFII